jgi:molybdenum cofactor biosynthesis protein B
MRATEPVSTQPGGGGDVSTEEHRAAGPRQASIFILTLSDTRDAESDTSGGAIRAALEGAGHAIAGYRILREDPDRLGREIESVLGVPGYDVLIMNGGTGLAPRDLAHDTLAHLYERPLPGFGELFRSLSYAEIGSAAMLSRASAGVARGKLVFSIPGSRGAVRLALEKLILPELGHLLGEMRRSDRPDSTS